MSTTATEAEFVAEWERWHADFEDFRRQPGNYLTITDIHWLTATPTALAGVPGLWWAEEQGPVVELAAGEELILEGVPLSDVYRFGVLPPHSSVRTHSAGEIIEIARRGDQYIVRPRDSAHPFLLAYEGTPAYAPDPRWRVPAVFRPWDASRAVELSTVIDGLQDALVGVGELDVTLDGQQFSLVALQNPVRSRGGFVLLFRDATSGVTTYAANRSVEVPEPDEVGNTVVDFTRAHNLPCAYSEFTTCPLPPAQNRLPIPVEAGEKTPLARIVREA